MMFQGSAHVGEEGYIRLLQQVGGRNINGLTSRDQTRYYQTLPANQLEKVLWLEADRMGFLLDTLYQQKLEAKRDIAKNERATLVDAAPTAGCWRCSTALSTPQSPLFQHAVWPGGGSGSPHPGGRAPVLPALVWAQQRHPGDRWRHSAGSDPGLGRALFCRAASVTNPDKPGGASGDAEEEPLSHPGGSGQRAHAGTGYPTVSAREPDFEALDLLADQLGGSASGLLQRQLQQSGQLVSVTARQECGVLACMLVIEAVPNLAKGGELGPIKAEIDRIVGQLASEGVSREQLAHSVNAQRAQRIWPLDSVAGKVEQLATGHTLFDDPNFQYRNLQRIAG